jgi:hypothetical protein
MTQFFLTHFLKKMIKLLFFEHSAKKNARKHGPQVLLAPTNLFSDETCGNISKSPMMFEILSFSLANLPFKICSFTKHSYVIFSANGVNATKQKAAVLKD